MLTLVWERYDRNAFLEYMIQIELIHSLHCIYTTCIYIIVWPVWSFYGYSSISAI